MRPEIDNTDETSAIFGRVLNTVNVCGETRWHNWKYNIKWVHGIIKQI